MSLCSEDKKREWQMEEGKKRKEKKSERKAFKRDKEIKEKDYLLSAASSGTRHCAAHAPSVKAVTC